MLITVQIIASGITLTARGDIKFYNEQACIDFVLGNQKQLSDAIHDVLNGTSITINVECQSTEDTV